jgi:glycosyltransferase involved in cell wall biosynthesis
MKSRVLILGKLPPPYFGPAIATEIILKSNLRDIFEVDHFNTQINETISTIGKKNISKLILTVGKYHKYSSKLKTTNPELILIPISQSTLGFLKDSIYIHLGIRSGAKILLHLRGSNLNNWLEKSNPIIRWYFGKTIKKGSGVIVLGDCLKYLFRDYFPDDRIMAVPNGGDFAYPQVPKKGKIYNILCLSNLFPAKGIEDVIDSAMILKDKGVTLVSFNLAGSWLDPGYESYCLKKINGSNLPVTVYSGISTESKKSLFAHADIFVFTPRDPEGHPWVIIEALAAGLPIISTDQGAISESVVDGENGFIVGTNNPAEIAEKIEFLVSHPDVYDKMRLESLRLYREKYTEEAMVRNLTSAFEKTLRS